MEMIDLDGTRIKNRVQQVIEKLSPVNAFFLIVKKHLREKGGVVSEEVINNIDRIDESVASAISLLDFLIKNIPEPVDFEGVMIDIIKQKKDRYSDVSIDYSEIQQKYQVDQRVLDVVNDILDIAIKLCKNNRINIQIQKNNDSNIKIIISEIEISDFHSIAESLEKFKKYINSLTIRIIKEVGNGDIFEITSPILFQPERGKIMIIELLTAQTVGAGMKFLFDRLGKLVDRKNDELLKKAEEVAKSAESIKDEQSLEIAKESMRYLRKISPEIDSIESFASWVEKEIRENFDELIGVGKLVVEVLCEKRKIEGSPQKRNKFYNMETLLNDDVQKFNDKLEMGDDGVEERKALFKRINAALALIKQ